MMTLPVPEAFSQIPSRKPAQAVLVLCLNVGGTSISHWSSNMDALARRFAETHDPEVRKQILALSQQQVRMTG
jgi:hypothetical protein